MAAAVAFSLITKLKFAVESKAFQKEIIKFGVAGQEICSGVRILLIETVQFVVALNGYISSTYDMIKAGDKLFSEGLSDFNYDRDSYAVELVLRVKHTDDLLAHILLRLFP